MDYSSSSLVLTAVQQERQIQKWSNELAVYCLGLNQGVNKKQVSGHLAWKKDEMLDTWLLSSDSDHRTNHSYSQSEAELSLITLHFSLILDSARV